MKQAQAPRKRGSLRSATLQQKMTAGLLLVVLQSILLTGIIVVVGSVYLSNFNVIMNDCYDINQLLSTYTQEEAAFRSYVLDRSEASYANYLSSRARTNRAMERVDITFAESREQYLLMQSIATAYESFRAACDEVVYRCIAGNEYADSYDRALRVSQYIDGYIKNLLQLAISQGQEIYQRTITRFRILPVLFIVSIILSLVCIVVWTRWMVKRVVSPINDLIRVTGAMSENQYDAPDIPVYQDDEISQLSLVVNEMKHSTARLVDSLKVQREIENRLHAEEMRRVTMEATMDTLRLSLLQSQINPHFLFNTLNIISRMALLENAPTTEDLIVRLANLFRYNLQSADDVVPLENELKIVEDYIVIQQIRFRDRITFTLACELNPAEYTVPVFTMQPLIENAVIHGISPMEEGGEITVSIGRKADCLVISVRDTGVGMSDAQVQALLTSDPLRRTHVSGLGIGNVRSRIAAHYPGSSFTIESRLDEGTIISISIPQTKEGATPDV